jgi:hypothetical protein
MEEENLREKFIAAVSSRIRDTEGCPVIVLVHTPAGLEIHSNFVDFALQMGVLDIAKMVTAVQFEQIIRAANASGQNAAFVKDIKEQIAVGKKKVN